MPISGENYTDIRNGTTAAFDDMAAVSTGRQIVPAADGTPEQVRSGLVTTNFFRVMGAAILLGRDFDEEDGTPPPAPAPVAGTQAAPPSVPTMAILSYEYWQRRFGGDAGILGKDLPGNGPRPPQRIVGVLAPGFQLLFRPTDNMEVTPDVWTALRLTYNNANRNGYFLRPIARLKDGVSLTRAQEEVESAASGIRRNFPLYANARFYERVEPMHAALVQEVRPAILALMGAAVFLLLIACANVTNLLLVRASLRRPRTGGPIGARRRPLAHRQADAGGGCAVDGDWRGDRHCTRVGGYPRTAGAGAGKPAAAGQHRHRSGCSDLHGRDFARSGRAVRPYPRVGRIRARSHERSSRKQQNGGTRARWMAAEYRRGIRSRALFRAADRIRPDVPQLPRSPAHQSWIRHEQPAHVSVARRAPRSASSARRERAHDSGSTCAIPGVRAATASFPFPLAGDFSTIRWGTEDALADNSKYQAVQFQLVRPGYFEAMHVPLLDGRTFTEADNDPKRNLVVVDQMLADKAFPRESAVGKRILVRVRTPEPEFVQIIGVVAHQRFASLADPGREEVFFADGFVGFAARKWAVRTAGDPASYTSQVRAELAKIDPTYVLADVAPMEALVARAQAHTRFSLMLIGVFAVIAALLVAVGLYGVLSTVVRQRTAEIGVRMALGAAPGSILRLVVGHGLRLSAAGIIVGILAALGLTRLMTTMLIGVKSTDPLTFGTMAVVFFALAAVSSWLPARRAAALDPTTALRE